MYEILEFYLFFSVEEDYTKRIARKFGKELELKGDDFPNFDKIPQYIIEYVLNNYKCLYYEEKYINYRNNNFNIKDKFKHISFRKHCENNENLTFFDYCKYGNFHMIKKLKTKLCDNIDEKYKTYYSSGIFPIILHQEGIGLLYSSQLDLGLLISVEYNHLKLAKYLCEMGANFRVQGCKAINIAITKGYLKILKYFYKIGYEFGIEEVILTIKCVQADILKFIVGKNPKILKDENVMIGAISAENMEIIKYLCEYCNIKIKYEDFLQACKENKLEIAKYFHSQNTRICNGKNLPLVISHYRGHNKIVDFLKKIGIRYDFGTDSHFKMWEPFDDL